MNCKTVHAQNDQRVIRLLLRILRLHFGLANTYFILNEIIYMYRNNFNKLTLLVDNIIHNTNDYYY